MVQFRIPLAGPKRPPRPVEKQADIEQAPSRNASRNKRFSGRKALMAELAKEIIRVNIEDEMRQSYLDYAMSVIVGRALPDVRDGLKPVHRRVLFGMHEANNVWNRPYVKCARIVGEVMGKYHPHGDSSIYDTLVRMAQPISRCATADRRPGQLRFDRRRQRRGDALHRVPPRSAFPRNCSPTSTRKPSTSARTTTRRNTSRSVLPTRVPNLLVNGSAGIAVGMATNVPPHNLARSRSTRRSR